MGNSPTEPSIFRSKRDAALYLSIFPAILVFAVVVDLIRLLDVTRVAEVAAFILAVPLVLVGFLYQRRLGKGRGHTQAWQEAFSWMGWNPGRASVLFRVTLGLWAVLAIVGWSL